MKKTTMTLTFAVALIGCLTAFSVGCGRPSVTAPASTIRIGWQIPLATQGQLVEVLKRTAILSHDKIDARFVPFSYGGPQSEAALAGQLDVIFVGDQPVINLIARGGRWKIVSRLFYTTTSIMVPPTSAIEAVDQLKNRTIATPFGSVAHREAILEERSVGLKPDKDVNNVNLDILEISNTVQIGGGKSWGKIDAVGVWEPSVSLFKAKGLAKGIYSARTLGVVSFSDEFISKHRAEAVKLLGAILKAWAYFATHEKEANQWYIDDSKLSYTPEILRMAAIVEPNYSAKSVADVDLRLKADNIATLQRGARWAHEGGFTRFEPDMSVSVDTTLLTEAVSQSAIETKGKL